jgi:hypothetical protein
VSKIQHNDQNIAHRGRVLTPGIDLIKRTKSGTTMRFPEYFKKVAINVLSLSSKVR